MKRNKIKETVNDLRDDFNSGVRALCGRPSPAKRLVIVLVIGCVLSVASVSALVKAIYSIGKRDAELLYIEHIKQLELKCSGDSIKNHKLKAWNNSPFSGTQRKNYPCRHYRLRRRRTIRHFYPQLAGYKRRQRSACEYGYDCRNKRKPV
jgi:hypothetical protein